MLKRRIVLALLMPLMACDASPGNTKKIYTNGNTVKGEAVSAALSFNGSSSVLYLTGKTGWACSSVVPVIKKGTSITSKGDLNCSGGGSGEVVFSNEESGEVLVNFNAGGGIKGSVYFTKESSSSPENSAISSGFPFIIHNYHSGRPDTANGVDVYIIASNLSKKTIKYVTYQATPYNAVGDIQMGSIRRNSTDRLTDTGPYQSQSDIMGIWGNVWYNGTISCIVINSVRIEYMDGSIKTYSSPSQVQGIMKPGLQNTCKI